MASLKDAEGRLFASAMYIEHRAALKLGESLRVGIGCRRQVPTRPVISFGFAGALAGDLPVGTTVVASKVVDEKGSVLWEGQPLLVRDANVCVVLASDHFVGSPQERAQLCKRSGATVVDMESGIYARLGLFAGSLRVISDTPSDRLYNFKGLWFGGIALKKLHSLSL